jgi:DHA2 family multidrug resistance protein
MNHTTRYTIPVINNIIPEKGKILIYILFVIIFQCSAGINLATASEMASGTALLHEDILMAGYASLIGMTLTFAIMLRLKLRFTSKVTFLVCSLGLVCCNLICLSTGNLLILISTCFIAGIFKMWATFEVNFTLQLWLTPKRDMSIFFCYVYLVVQGSILIGGSTDIYIALIVSWHYFHWIVIGALLMVAMVVLLLFNSTKPTLAFPLLGVDWLGALLWGLILLCVNFICLYGEHYDWWYAGQIQVATLFLVILLALNIYRASFIRHPFIPLQLFKYKAVYITLFLYLIADTLLSPAHLIEHIYFGEILQYDANHVLLLNCIGWLGLISGAVFTLYYFALKKNSYKSTFLIGFACIVMYLLFMYFIIDYNTTKELLIAPIFLRSFGNVVIAIVLITNLVKVPFVNLFQAISIQGFVSAACGMAITGAIPGEVLKFTTAKNFQLLSANFDSVNYSLATIKPHELQELLQKQVLMVSFKEIYGELLIGGLGCFVILLFFNYPYLPVKIAFPKMSTITKLLKKEIA